MRSWRKCLSSLVHITALYSRHWSLITSMGPRPVTKFLNNFLSFSGNKLNYVFHNCSDPIAVLFSFNEFSCCSYVNIIVLTRFNLYYWLLCILFSFKMKYYFLQTSTMKVDRFSTRQTWSDLVNICVQSNQCDICYDYQDKHRRQKLNLCVFKICAAMLTSHPRYKLYHSSPLTPEVNKSL